MQYWEDEAGVAAWAGVLDVDNDLGAPATRSSTVIPESEAAEQLDAVDASPDPDEEPDPAAEEAPDPVPEPPPTIPAANDAPRIDFGRILTERPDVLQAFHDGFYVSGASKHPESWMRTVGGTKAEDFARFWYDNHGRFEGYNQGPTTAANNISVEKILEDRPDVLQAFYASMRNGHHSKKWVKEVGADTPEAFARHWYIHTGRWEGYSQSEDGGDSINLDVLLADRPDITRAFYREYYGPNNDQNSSAWANRFGGETLKDYAKHWYVHYAKAEGYTQNAARTQSMASPEQEAAPEFVDPSLDPWNHPAIFPDYVREPEPGSGAAPDVSPAGGVDIVGQSLGSADLEV